MTANGMDVLETLGIKDPKITAGDGNARFVDDGVAVYGRKLEWK